MHLPPRSARPARLALATLALVVATLLAGLLAAPAPARAVASQVLEPGASVDVSGVGEDTRFVVSRAGTYSFSGTSSRATIYVNASPGDEVTLVLEDGLALTPSSGAPIEVFAEYDASEQARVDVLMGVGSNASLTGGSRSPAIRVTTFDMTNSQAAPPGDDPIVTIGCQDDRYGTLLDLRGGSGAPALAIAGYGDVALTGGSVYATSGGGGAGVSCPEGATVAAGEVRQGAFVVTGGLLSAQGGSGAPGIGSARGDVAVRIEGGTVSVNGGAGAPAIGSVEGDATVSVTGGSVTPASGSAPGVPAIGSVSGTADLSVSGGTVDVEGFSYGELALGSAGGTADVRISGGTVAVGLASCGSSAEVGEDDDPPAVVEVTGGSYTGFAAGTGLANNGVGRDDMAVNAAGTVVWRTVVELEGAKVRTSVESLDVRGAAPAYGTGGIQTRPMWVQDASRPVVVVWIPINAEVVGATDDYVNCYSGEVHPTPSASAGLSYGALERVPNLTIDANSDAGYDGSVWVTRFSTTIQVEEEVVSNDDRMLAGVFDAPEGGNMVMDAQYRLQPNVEGWTGPAGRWERGGAPFTLYAQWRDPYFTVSFDANGGTGSMDPQEIDLGVTTALSPCAYRRTGHSLTGWNTEADGTGTAYAPGAEVSDLAAAGETVTLYAQWEPVTYTLRYDGNGGVTGHGYTEYSFTQTYGDPITIEPNIYFRRAGYEFVDWNTKPDGSGDSYRGWDVVGDLSGTAGDTVTLYAQWEPLAVSSYEISFEANAPATASTEPTGSMDAQEDVPCGTTATLPSVGFRLPGYRFAGWNTEPDGTGDAYADAAEVRDLAAPGESATLYAQWKPLTYHVTFVHGEGQGATYTQAFAFDDAAALVSNVFVGPTGAAFAGWRDEATGALYADCAQVVNACTVGADGSLEGHTFVAQWARSGVTVVLAHDGAPLALDDPGTEIELVPEGGGEPLAGFAAGTAEGTYVLADVPPGTYGLDVGATGDDGSLLYPTSGLSVTVEAGTPAVLRADYFTVTVEAGEPGVAPGSVPPA